MARKLIVISLPIKLLLKVFLMKLAKQYFKTAFHLKFLAFLIEFKISTAAS